MRKIELQQVYHHHRFASDTILQTLHVPPQPSVTIDILQHEQANDLFNPSSVSAIQPFNQQTTLISPANLNLRRRLSFFCFIATLSVLLLLVIHDLIFFKSMFLLTYYYLSYLVADSIGLIYYKKVQGWRAKNCFLDIFLILSIMMAAIFVDLKLSGYILSCNKGLWPFAITNCIYSAKSQMPDPSKLKEDIKRFAALIQINLIMMTLDTPNTMSWTYILVPSLIISGTMGLCIIPYAITSVKLVTAVICQAGQDNMKILKTRLAGRIWRLMNSMMFCAAFGFLIGVDHAYSSEQDYMIIESCAKVSLAIVILTLAFAFICFEPLLSYVELL